jgi:multiple sugar transport system substrate-binding protein
MIEVAKKLTIKDGDKIVQAGLNFNNDFHQNYLLGLNYQLGENLFQEDGKTPNVNSDAMKKVMQMLVDMYDKDQIGSKDFGENCADSFGQGQSAMVLQWGHYYNTLKTTWSDIDFGVFEIPTFDGNPYAYNRYNGESTFGVNKNAPKDQQAVAQDFVKFFLCDDETQVAFNLAMSTFPAKKSLADNEKILENPSLKVLAEHIDHYIWPGPMPSCVEDNMKKAGEDIFYNGVDIDTALDKAQADIIKDMKSSSFQSVENLYEFAK